MKGRHDPLHGQSSITERVILDWAREEASLLRPPATLIQLAENTAEKQEALRERMTRLGRAHVDGMIPEFEYNSERESLTKRLLDMELQGRSVRLEPVNWSREPTAVNQALRALWSHVQLGPDLRPAFAAWTLPAWRAQTPEGEQEPGSAAAPVGKTKTAA